MSDSTGKPDSRKADRPRKPYPAFPLAPHPTGKWQKKILGKIHYFGRWAKRVNGRLVRIEGDGWQEALAIYKSQADDLHAGRTPRVKSGALTVMDLCNAFLTAKLRQLEAGEIGQRMFSEYRSSTDLLVMTFGKTRLIDDLAADDFEKLRDDMAKRNGPVRLGNEVQKVRTIFRYAYESGLIDRPVRFGPQFKKPTASVLRRHKAAQGPKLFAADEIKAMLSTAGPQLKAMILLGINCAYGNHDVAMLPRAAIDLEGGWATFNRPKTGLARKAKLWLETVAALQEVLAARQEAEPSGLVFVTKFGKPWSKGGFTYAVSHAMKKLLSRLRISSRPGISFYALRHSFRTIADATKDVAAIRLVMGHADGSIDSVYREKIDDSRLVAVAEHVREWLFGKPNDGETGKTDIDTMNIPNETLPIAPNEGTALRLYVG